MASSGLAPGFSGAAAALHADHVAAFAAGDLDVIGLLQLLHEIGEGAGAVGLLVEGGVELQHGGFQQAELRPDFAALEHAERALHQRHGLRQIERDALVRRRCCCCCCCGCWLLLRAAPAGCGLLLVLLRRAPAGCGWLVLMAAAAGRR